MVKNCSDFPRFAFKYLRNLDPLTKDVLKGRRGSEDPIETLDTFCEEKLRAQAFVVN